MTASVLVVDDDDDLRETICDVLSDEGIEFASAANGEEALAYLRSAPLPSMILLDLSMPVMDGVTFREIQRADPALAGIPVVVFSAAASVAEKVRDLGVDMVLKKPLKLDQLLAIVENYCGPRSAAGLVPGRS